MDDERRDDPSPRRAELTERRLAAQFALSEVLGAASSLASAAPRLLGVLDASLGADASELWIVDDAAGELVCEMACVSGDPASAFSTAALALRFRRGEGLPGRVWQRGEPLWVDDVTLDAQFARREEARAAGLRAGVAFPIRFAGRTLGVIQFFLRVPSPPDSDALHLFRDVGSQLGLFIERLRMDERLARQGRELESLSTPVLRVWEQVIAVPIIGTLDAVRADRMMARVLQSVVDARARFVLLDVTGLATADAHVARHLGETIRAVRLVGARVGLTGVAPKLAVALAALGADLGAVEAWGSLADGLKGAIGALGTPSA